MVPVEQLLVVAAVLLFAGVFASRLSDRFGIPALLLFLAIGMLAGSDGPGGIWFDNAFAAQFIGVVALVFILFAGGLDTDWSSVRPVVWRGVTLATFGVAVTAALVGWFATWLLGLSLLEGMLLGAIVSSTDAAAVFGVLRTQKMSLKHRLQPLLELESGSNDPMAVFLTLGFTQLLVNPQIHPVQLVPLFAQQMVLGGVIGYGAGRLGVFAVNRIQLQSEGLYPVLTLALALLTYGGIAALGGSGFLGVYVLGIVMGNADFLHKRSLARFHDALAWLSQITMFLTLGLLVFPSRLPPVVGSGILLALFLVFVARPVSVFLSLAFAQLGFRDRLLISWVGLRGAVPIILATFPLVAGLPGADLYFNLVFFIVVASVLVQGPAIPLVARVLRLQSPAAPRRGSPLEFLPAMRASSDLVEVVVPEESPAIGRQIVDLRLPPSALAVLIGRADDYIVPRGNTVLRPGDNVLVLADRESIGSVRAILEGDGTRQS